MVELTTEQQIYLLYASAYTKADTVTKSTVKSYLPKKWKGKAEAIYSTLQSQKLIKQTSRGRFCVTDKGKDALVINLVSTDYKFDSVKGPKVLNLLLDCIQKAAEKHLQVMQSEEISFDEFERIFKALYFEERRQQEIQGVVAIHGKDLCQKFMQKYSISANNLEQYFERLKSTGKIFAVEEKGHELIEWVE